jgi:hypothetical protein
LIVEDFPIWGEPHCGPCPPRWFPFDDLRGGLAPLIGLAEVEAVPFDLDLQAFAQRVDHRGSHAVQAAGHLVGVVVELASGVKRGENHLQRAFAGLGMQVHWDAPAIVADRKGAPVGFQLHHDPAGVAVHNFINGIVHDFPAKVM